MKPKARIRCRSSNMADIEPQTLWNLKSQALSKQGFLSLHRGGETFEELGGLTALKAFCKRSLLDRPVKTPSSGPRACCCSGFEEGQRYPSVEDVVPAPEEAVAHLELSAGDAKYLREVLPQLPFDVLDDERPVTIELNGKIGVRARSMKTARGHRSDLAQLAAERRGSNLRDAATLSAAGARSGAQAISVL